MRGWKHLSYLILLGLIVGLLGTGFRMALDYSMKLLNQLIHHQTTFPTQVFVSVGVTCILVFIAWKSVKHFAPEAAGSGIQEVERALLHHTPIRWWRTIPVKFVGGLLSLGGKLVLGREGPTVQLGASAGAMVSDWLGLSSQKARGLIAAGAAAGLATAFNAPLAGIVFVFEEFRPHFVMSWSHLQSVTVVCAVAVMVLYLLIGNVPSIQMGVYHSPPLSSLFIFLCFGFVVAGVGWIFNVSLIKILNHTEKLSSFAKYIYVLSGGALVGLSAVISPSWVTGGDGILEQILNSPIQLHSLFFTLFARWILGLICYSLGVPGGIFSPILVLGSLTGLLFFNCLHPVCVFFGIEPAMLALAGMSGLFAAIVRSPLTAVVLIIEMTKNGALVLPLLLTSLVASLCMNGMRNAPIYTQLLNRKHL